MTAFLCWIGWHSWGPESEVRCGCSTKACRHCGHVTYAGIAVQS